MTSTKLRLHKNNNLIKIVFMLFLLLHVLYMVMWGTKKINYHVDEYYTYGLANNRGSIEPVWEDGKIYEGDTVFLNYLAPDESERFDYSIVWENQAKDVHPPLYYIFVHTICSFFPNIFSKWEALTLNLVFLTIVDILVYFIAKLLIKNQWTSFWAMALNGMTVLCLNMVLFLRMYVLMTVFVLGVTLLFLKYWNRSLDKLFYILLFFLSVGGALTQYYFLIYLFFSVLIFEIIRLIQNRWGKETILSILTLAGAGVVSIMIFPAMLEQIFGDGYRGQEAFENARTLTDVPRHITEYARIINNELFGGWGIVILFFSVCFIILTVSKYQKKLKKILPLLILLIPAVCYCLVISVIAPYQYDRYIMGVGPLFVLAAIYFVYQTMNYALSDKSRLPEMHELSCSLRYAYKEKHHRFINTIIVVLFGIMILSSMSVSKWDSPYTYQSTKSHLEIAEKYKDCHILFVYNAPWTVNDKMQELIQYQDYTFLKEQEVSNYKTTNDRDDMIVYISNSIKMESVIPLIQKNNPELTRVEMLYRDAHPDFASVYHLSCKNSTSTSVDTSNKQN